MVLLIRCFFLCLYSLLEVYGLLFCSLISPSMVCSGCRNEAAEATFHEPMGRGVSRKGSNGGGGVEKRSLVRSSSDPGCQMISILDNTCSIL